MREPYIKIGTIVLMLSMMALVAQPMTSKA
jgi:hypothetical protein